MRTCAAQARDSAWRLRRLGWCPQSRCGGRFASAEGRFERFRETLPGARRRSESRYASHNRGSGQTAAPSGQRRPRSGLLARRSEREDPRSERGDSRSGQSAGRGGHFTSRFGHFDPGSEHQAAGSGQLDPRRRLPASRVQACASADPEPVSRAREGEPACSPPVSRDSPFDHRPRRRAVRIKMVQSAIGAPASLLLTRPPR